LIITIINFCVI